MKSNQTKPNNLPKFISFINPNPLYTRNDAEMLIVISPE